MISICRVVDAVELTKNCVFFGKTSYPVITPFSLAYGKKTKGCRDTCWIAVSWCLGNGLGRQNI